jgi:hypothetical protein
MRNIKKEKTMKRLIAVLAVVIIGLSVPVLSVPSLGVWNEGDPGTTHQFWDFTPMHVAFNPGDGYTATPDTVISPDSGAVLATVSPRGTYNSDLDSFIARTYLSVSLEIPNYDVLNPIKVIWVDIGDAVVYPEDIGISAAGHDIPGTNYACELIFNDEGKAEEEGVSKFGIIIRPNPEVEKLTMFFGPQTVLDYIHVDTICTVPEPATICILGLGALCLIRRKR